MNLKRPLPPFAAAVLAGFLPSKAMATELVWDGHYRTRFHLFDSLSVSNENPRSEGAAVHMDHRLRLRPGWLITDHVSLFTQLDLLPYTLWGEDPEAAIDPVTGDPLALGFTETVVPTQTEEGGLTSANLQVTRVWAEVASPIGRFRLGRMPVEWGTGMVWNAGNGVIDEYGDTADRIQLASKAGPVYILGAFETNYEGFLGEPDDMQTITSSVLYKTENVSIGTYNTFRYQSYEGDRFNAFTGDIFASAEMGPARAEAEFAAVLGGGDLDTGANDVSIAAFGAFLSLGVDTDTLIGGIAGGLATGDSDTEDRSLRTFTFDRDFNRTLLLFEEPMPTLEASVKNEANEGRDYGAVRTGNALSNVLFLQPTVGYRLRPDLSGTLSLFASQAARLPDAESANKGYGLELDAAVRYDPFPNTFITSTVGLWFPGKYFTNYEDEDLGGDFDRPVTGVRIIGAVEF